MRKVFVIAAALMMLFVLASCTSLKIRMGESSDFHLLPLASVGEPLDSYQLVSGTFPGFDEGMSLEAWLVWDDQSLELMLFAPTGQTMGKVLYDGERLSFESTFMPEHRILGMYIVADMQLCFATSEALETEFGENGMILIEGFDDGRLTCRSVFEDGSPVYEITYSDNVISVTNSLRGYSYTIEIL